jgi:hypothetical protein
MLKVDGCTVVQRDGHEVVFSKSLDVDAELETRQQEM